MYEVMKAIYDSGIPISFKGSMVLKASLFEAGYFEDTRHTVDIDANWNTDKPPSAKQMIESLQKALKQTGIELNINLYRMYSEGRSAGFEFKDNDTDELYFTMDIDVNRPMIQTKLYELGEFRFRGAVPAQMVVDKILVISTEKIYRRIKDVVDLYYMSKVFSFHQADVRRVIESNGGKIGDFSDFLSGTDNLRYAYEKFRFEGGVHKPPFEEVYKNVKAYIRDMIPNIKL